MVMVKSTNVLEWKSMRVCMCMCMCGYAVITLKMNSKCHKILREYLNVTPLCIFHFYLLHLLNVYEFKAIFSISTCLYILFAVCDFPRIFKTTTKFLRFHSHNFLLSATMYGRAFVWAIIQPKQKKNRFVYFIILHVASFKFFFVKIGIILMVLLS